MLVSILQIILGSIELFMGRRLFWLIVGIVGFLFGIFVTVNYLHYGLWLNLLIGLVVGAIFAGLAMMIPKTMTAILGFVGFGVAAGTIAAQFGLEQAGLLYWIIFIGAGLFGASLVFWLFDWALILGTSVIGTSSIMTGLGDIINISRASILWMLFFLFILVIGISVQSNELKRSG